MESYVSPSQSLSNVVSFFNQKANVLIIPESSIRSYDSFLLNSIKEASSVTLQEVVKDLDELSNSLRFSDLESKLRGNERLIAIKIWRTESISDISMSQLVNGLMTTSEATFYLEAVIKNLAKYACIMQKTTELGRKKGSVYLPSKENLTKDLKKGDHLVVLGFLEWYNDLWVAEAHSYRGYLYRIDIKSGWKSAIKLTDYVEDEEEVTIIKSFARLKFTENEDDT